MPADSEASSAETPGVTTLSLLQADLDNCLDAAREAALFAWKRIEHFFQGDYRVYEKENEGPATEADILADHLIVDFLQERFSPDHFGYLSEETQQGHQRLGKDLCWIIDPIDGTRDFIEGRDDFCLQIGLAARVDQNGPLKPVAGVVYEPRANRLALASHGAGAFEENLKTGQVTRMEVTKRAEVAGAHLVVTRQHFGRRLKTTVDHLDAGEVSRRGSFGVKVIDVAAGRADYYLNTARRQCKEWDTCAPHAILLEAGGRLTNLSGKELSYNRRSFRIDGGALASNGFLHGELLQRLEGIDVLWEKMA